MKWRRKGADVFAGARPVAVFAAESDAQRVVALQNGYEEEYLSNEVGAMRRVLNEVMETVALPPSLAKSVRDAIRD